MALVTTRAPKLIIHNGHGDVNAGRCESHSVHAVKLEIGASTAASKPCWAIRDPDRRETEKRETEERETEKKETEKWETEMQ